MTTPAVHLDGVGLTFDAEVVLAGIDLRVTPGESVAILGPSGSGKSSLLLAIAGLVRPTAGRILIAGQDLVGQSAEELASIRRTKLGVVFQFGELVPELSLLENVALPLRLEGTGRRAAETEAENLLDQFDLGGAAHRRPGEVSGGQVQRAAIARALIHQPAVVLADEPTGALGVDHAPLVQELLFEATRARGAALVIATHAPELADGASRTYRIADHGLESIG